MSEKQLGAAPGDETSPEAGRRSGWFGRLRAQPGFRTAAVAFVLTVVLGIGSTVAYAYWGQRNTVSQSVTVVRTPLPTVTGKTSCEQFGWGPATIRFSPVASDQLPAGARVLLTVSIPDRKSEKLFAVPNNGTVFLRDLPGLSDAIGVSLGRRILISATTAYLSDQPAALPATVSDANVIDRARPPAQGAEAVFVASYFC